MAATYGISMNRVSIILLCIAVALVSSILVFIAAIAILYFPTHERNNAASACKAVKVGMTFAQMNATIHGTSSFFHETADFTRNEYVYSGHDGSCSVSMGPDGAQVAKVQFDALPEQNASSVR
jgi:hypothetical protein